MLFLICIFLVISAIISGNCNATVTLPWSTTFNCDDWTAPNALSCDGMYIFAGGACTPENSQDQIGASSNYPIGGGGKGNTFWIGAGEENNSGALGVQLTTGVGEFWMRGYVKYSSSITWNGSSVAYQKMFYITGESGAVYIIPELYEQRFRVATGGTGGSGIVTTNDYGWDAFWDDGDWHCLELHIKTNTSNDPYDGVIQLWLDNVLAIDNSTADLGGVSAVWTTFHWGSNSSSPTQEACQPVFFDDLAISNTGRIGLLTRSSLTGCTISGASMQ
jgi:hypothetical protein